MNRSSDLLPLIVSGIILFDFCKACKSSAELHGSCSEVDGSVFLQGRVNVSLHGLQIQDHENGKDTVRKEGVGKTTSRASGPGPVNNLTLQQNFVSGSDGTCKPSSFRKLVAEMGMCIPQLLAVVDVSPHTHSAAAEFSESGKACIHSVEQDLENARRLSAQFCSNRSNGIVPQTLIEVIDYADTGVVANIGKILKHMLNCTYDDTNVQRPVSCTNSVVRNVSGTIFDAMSSMMKNSVAYLYTLSLVKTQYLLHVDDDVQIVTHGGRWVSRAIEALGANHSIPAVSFQQPYGSNGSLEYDCHHAKQIDWPYEVRSVGENLIAMDGINGHPHLSMQAFIMDVPRVMECAPFLGESHENIYHAHIEYIFEVGLWNAHSVPVFMDASYGCKSFPPVGDSRIAA